MNSKESDDSDDEIDEEDGQSKQAPPCYAMTFEHLLRVRSLAEARLLD